MKIQIILFSLFFILVSNIVFAVKPDAKQLINHKEWSFVENKGQLIGENGKFITDVKFYSHEGGANIFCSPNKISFVFKKIESEKKKDISEATGTSLMPTNNHEISKIIKISVNRVELILLHSNPNAQITARDQQEYFENYYTTGDTNHGITNVHTYKTIIYKEIYPHIDMVLKAKEGGMKYEFEVKPGGNPNDIQLRWNGLGRIKKSQNAGIEYTFPIGKMTESAPITYNGSSITESYFILQNKGVCFKIGKYNNRKVLVIDPTLIWATYQGGNANDESNGVSTDALGNVYITGYTSSTSGMASSGSFQSFSGGQQDAFLAKFNSAGNRMWATYYGGKLTEVAYGISEDITGNIYVTGEAGSNGLATSGAYQTFNPASRKAFLAKFNSLGSMVWATYYGGENQTVGSAICMDGLGNVYITGLTQSTGGLATVAAYQTSYGGGFDAFLAKFSSAGNLYWATYFGGIGDDIAWGASTDASGNVYISGNTNSTTNIATTGAFQTSTSVINGSSFIAKFKGNGNILWATYYHGNGADDLTYAMATDGQGSVYITGSTNSSNLATPGAYQPLYGGGNGDAFLAKFNDIGNLLWCTYYGGSLADHARGICSDALGNMYITGYTLSTNGIATLDAYKKTYNGGTYDGDAFLAKFSGAGSMYWATYFGGSFDEYGSAVCADLMGNIYITGYTNSDKNIATVGSFQDSFAGGFDDAFLAKFNFPYHNDAGVTAILSPSDSSCPGFQPVNIRLKNFGNQELNFINIHWAVNGIAQPTYSWSGAISSLSDASISIGKYNFQPGTQVIKAWSSKPNGQVDSFPFNDSSTATLKAYPYPKAVAGPDTTLCYNQTYTMQGAGGTTYLWTPAKYLSSDTIAKPKAALPNTQLYTLYIHDWHGCLDSSKVLLTVKPKLNISLLSPSSPVCYGTQIKIIAKGKGGDSLHYSFSWTHDSVNGTTLNKMLYASGWHTVVLNDNCSALPAKDSVYISVLAKPIVKIIVPQPLVCYGTSMKLVAKGSGGDSIHYSFSWPDDSMTGATLTRKIYTSGWHQVILNDNCSVQTAKDSVFINVRAKTMVKMAGFQIPVCYGSTVLILAKATGGDSLHYSFTWPYDNASGKLLITKLYKSGWHKVILNDNCTPMPANDSVFIDVLPKPVPDFSILNRKPYVQDTLFRFWNLSKYATSYAWSFGDSSSSNPATNPTHLYTDTGTYRITLIAANSQGCSDTTFGHIHIFSKYINIYIPNTFSPNSDGINDEFLIKGLGFINYHYTIYNRWGELLFESIDTRKNWDGSFKGQPVIDGVYLFMLTVTDQFGNFHYYSGNINVLR